MYKSQGGYVKRLGPQQKWERLNAIDVPVRDLHHHFQDGYLFITHPLYDGVHHLRLRDIPQHLRYSDLVVDAWLESLGNEGLPLKEGRIHFDEVDAPYEDAWRAGCSITPIHRHYHQDQSIPDSDKKDLLIEHPGATGVEMREQCLVTVNGFFHYTGAREEGLQVIDGAVNGRKCNDNRVGLWALGELGKLSLHRVRKEHLVNRAGDPYRNGVTLQLDPNIDLKGKSVFLVLGGVFHYTDHYVKRIGEHLFRVDMAQYPFPQHVFDLERHYDLSRMKHYHDRSTVNETQVAVEELYSDPSIETFFTLPCTFFVVVDAPEVFYEEIRLESTQLPGVVKSPVVPRYPLKHRLGRFVEYWSRRDAEEIKFYFSDDYETYYTFETTHWKDQNSIDASRVPAKPYDYGRAFLVKLTTYR